MNTDILRIAISKKYSTLSECAEAVGMTISNFSKGLKNPSSKFLAKLEAVGVDLEKYQKSNVDIERIAVENEYAKLIIEQDKILDEKEKIITELKNLVNQKDKIIQQYETLLKSK